MLRAYLHNDYEDDDDGRVANDDDDADDVWLYLREILSDDLPVLITSSRSKLSVAAR